MSLAVRPGSEAVAPEHQLIPDVLLQRGHPAPLQHCGGTQRGGAGQSAVTMVTTSSASLAPLGIFTFVLGPKHKNSVTRHNFKLVVLGWAGHLHGSQWDHSFRVDVLREHRGQSSTQFNMFY